MNTNYYPNPTYPNPGASGLQMSAIHHLVLTRIILATII